MNQYLKFEFKSMWRGTTIIDYFENEIPDIMLEDQEKTMLVIFTQE